MIRTHGTCCQTLLFLAALTTNCGGETVEDIADASRAADGPDTCSPVACSLDCPLGLMTDASGCELCACDAPVVVLEVAGFPPDPEPVSFEVHSSLCVGATDRSVLEFSWGYDLPETADEEVYVSVQLRLQPLSTDVFPEPTTFSLLDESAPIEHTRSTLQSAWLGGVDLTLTEGFLTIWQEGGRVRGRIYLVFEARDAERPGIVLAAPFQVNNPWLD